MDVLLSQYTAHWHNTVCQPLCGRDEIRCHAETFSGERFAQAAECRYDLVKNQQDTVPVADFSQPLQVANGRRNNSGGSGDRFDNDSRDITAIVEGCQPLEVVGKVCPRVNAFSSIFSVCRM